MKKLFALLLAVLMVVSMAACAPEADPTESTDAVFDPAAKSEGVLTYAEYAAADMDTEVTIEAYVQACQGWWENDGQGVITVYAQDPEGAYFLYNMACAQEDAAKLTKGTKIRVKGYKSEYKGEVEIIDATFEILEGTWTAEAEDITAMLSREEGLIKMQNRLVAFKGMTVLASTDADGNEVPFLYNWNGSGERGSDLYFKASVNGKTVGFCVESYLCGEDTEVYKAVEALKIGDTVDIECFLYWYDGVNPHVTGVTVLSGEESSVLTYAEYIAAELDTEVTIEAYVQDCQGWWEKDGQGVITVYTQDEDGAYFLYNMACAQEDAAKLTKGTKIRVTGYKAEYKGEVEIIDATFEILEGSWTAEAADLTASWGDKDALLAHQNELVIFKGLTVEASTDADGKEVAFLYNWNGSGEEGDDLYFNASINGVKVNFCVESYLRGQETDVYKAVKDLQVGDTIDITCYLYWYDGVNPHVIGVEAAA